MIILASKQHNWSLRPHTVAQCYYSRARSHLIFFQLIILQRLARWFLSGWRCFGATSTTFDNTRSMLWYFRDEESLMRKKTSILRDYYLTILSAHVGRGGEPVEQIPKASAISIIMTALVGFEVGETLAKFLTPLSQFTISD